MEHASDYGVTVMMPHVVDKDLARNVHEYGEHFQLAVKDRKITQIVPEDWELIHFEIDKPISPLYRYLLEAEESLIVCWKKPDYDLRPPETHMEELRKYLSDPQTTVDDEGNVVPAPPFLQTKSLKISNEKYTEIMRVIQEEEVDSGALQEHVVEFDESSQIDVTNDAGDVVDDNDGGVSGVVDGVIGGAVDGDESRIRLGDGTGDKTETSQPAVPESIEPQSVEPQPVEPQPVEAQPIEPKPAEPQPAEPPPAEPPVEPPAAEPPAADPPAAEPPAAEPPAAEPPAAEPPTAEPPVDTVTVEPEPVEPQPVETANPTAVEPEKETEADGTKLPTSEQNESFLVIQEVVSNADLDPTENNSRELIEAVEETGDDVNVEEKELEKVESELLPGFLKIPIPPMWTSPNSRTTAALIYLYFRNVKRHYIIF